jgi:DNA mismatch repair protein MutL
MDLETENNRINLLPEHLIDQIKAGEVVERPANVLKELLENSIDAGATEVKVTIKENGLDLIAIEDNGNGMFYEELPYAFCRHATSKINSFEDIYRLNTFGFRGEALASISSVSRISCHSAPKKDLEQGGKLIIHGAQTVEHSYYRPGKSGTSIYVKDLFYNTPVRLKFVKSKISEKNALRRIINAFLVSYPHVKFSVSWDDKDREIYSPFSDERKADRIKNVIGKKKNTINLMESQNSYLSNSIRCFISKESTKGNTGKHHYLFVNNRLFTDKKIHQIIIRNMEKFWTFGQTGHYFIELTVPEHEIDVNVHPNKTLIKFLKANEVFSLISASVKKLISENKPESDFDLENSPTMEFGENRPLDNILNSPVWDRMQDSSSSSFFDSGPDLISSGHKIGQVDMFTNKSEQEIIDFGANLFVLNTENGPYFINMDEGLKDILISLYDLNDVPLTPLLISEPLSFETFPNESEILESLKDVGFEIDRIDSHTLVLRTTPTAIETYSYKAVIEAILSQINGSVELTKIDFSDIPVSIENAAEYIKSNELINLIKAGVAKKMSGRELKKKVYGRKKK